jgi:hypothetical protein
MTTSYSGASPFTVRRPVSHVGAFKTVTIAGDTTLTYRSASMLKIDPGGAGRNITLPAPRPGGYFRITNAADADEGLVVGYGGSTVGPRSDQNERCEFFVESGSWTFDCIETIALS